MKATRIIEKYVFDKLKDYNKTYSTRVYKSEWYEITNDALIKIMLDVRKAFPEDCDDLIYRWREPRIHIFEIDGYKVDTDKVETQENPQKYLAQEGQISKRGRLIRSTAKTRFKDMLFIL